MRHLSLTLLPFLVASALCRNILLTNDDGWATAQIRAQNDALLDAGFHVRIRDHAISLSLVADTNLEIRS